MSDSSGTKQSTLRTALAGLIGNLLEWFDFAVYGYFASNIGHQFFPKSDPAVQIFLAYATFALGFFARPVGSIVLGRVGDRIGRKALLTLSGIRSIISRRWAAQRWCSGSCPLTTRSVFWRRSS